MTQPANTPIRCAWARSPEEAVYHDQEWGVPCLDDKRHFEFLVLESAQAGLSWLTILRKRQGYHACFAGFDPEKVARFSQDEIRKLMLDASIIRNLKKIESAVNNAGLFLKIQEKYGSFNSFIWSFVNGKVIDGKRKKTEHVPAVTPEAERLAKEMKAMGFRFLGPTVLYAHMQATGLVNDHLTNCFRYQEVKKLAKTVKL